MTREEAIKILQKLYEGCNKHKNTDLIKEAYNLAIEALKAQADLQPNCNELATDVISRQAAIDAAREELESGTYFDIPSKLEALPSARPERKTGKWIERNPQNSDKCRLIECDQCGFSHIVGFNVPYEHWIENRNFCERCGADMRGEPNED